MLDVGLVEVERLGRPLLLWQLAAGIVRPGLVVTRIGRSVGEADGLGSVGLCLIHGGVELGFFVCHPEPDSQISKLFYHLSLWSLRL